MVYERWTDPDSDFEKVRVTSDMCPRLTAGAEETQEGQIHRVAKTILISRLEAAMHAKELHVAAELSEAETLREEL
ncbi:hypothetical protein [Bradyrhizobium sp. AZCC 1578]|uniref:hypothetical protein n=1 Tax=Bradyrhizobium sp. AZCC 1578 TaxID=3117027 RepID=UPI002FF2F4D8